MKKQKTKLPPLVSLILAWKKNTATTYTPTNILRDHADNILYMIKLLQDIEVCARVNCAIQDGSPIHKGIVKILDKIEGAA